MASTINASTSSGIVQTADTSGVLQLQTNGTTGMAISVTQQVSFPNSISSPNTFGFKNRIINGGMVIDQRNAGASSTPPGSGAYYSLDRWRGYYSNSGKFTVQQNAGSVTLPVGFKNYLGVTSSSAYTVVASDYYTVSQLIEGFNISDLGWGTANAQSVTLSFKVYSSLTGTFGGSITNSAENRCYPFTYSISVANTWTTISITIPGDTTGTWLSTNGTGMEVNFSLGAGSTYGSGTANAWSSSWYIQTSGCVNVVGTNGATFYITGVQLEVGSQATSFDFRSYGTELALCQRYNLRLGSPFDASKLLYVGMGGGATTSNFSITYPVSMRTTPTLTYSLGSGFTVNNGTSAYAVSALALNGANIQNYVVTATQSNAVTGAGVLYYSTSTDMYINLSAEL